MARKNRPRHCTRCASWHIPGPCPSERPPANLQIPTLEHPSPLYLQCLREAQQHHASSKTYSGKFLRPHGPLIKQHIDELGGVRSILDYGCGKGAQYEWVSHGEDASIPKNMTLEQFWGATVYRYDPAWPPYATPPPAGEQFDLVLCTHTLGSIPITDLPWVLRELFARTRFLLYIAEKIGPVNKQVFSETERMPRWSALQWRNCIAAILDDWKQQHLDDLADDDEGGIWPRVWFVSREKTDDRGVVMAGAWV